MHRIFLRLAATILFLSPMAQARWAHIDEAETLVLSDDEEWFIHKDGTMCVTSSIQVKIQNEYGRNKMGTVDYTFNAQTQKIDILEASITTNGITQKVKPESIEIKPLSSNLHGFDEKQRALISFPNAVVGAVVNLKIRLSYRQTPTPHDFAYTIYFGEKHATEKKRVMIRSEIPLKMKKNDRDMCLEIQESKGANNEQIICIEQKKPCFKKIVSEPSEAFPHYMEHSERIWVSLSSHDTYASLAKHFVNGYEEIISKPLPVALVAIKEKARLEKTMADQINCITSSLVNMIRYHGDWCSLKGQFFPRSIEEIVSSGVADCKEYSAITVAILRSLGIDAHVALVMRGLFYTDSEGLPQSNFNHAIVHISDAEGKSVWIDPTNFISAAPFALSDIANRPSLVLHPKKYIYERIPAIRAEDSITENKMTLNVQSDHTIRYEGEVKMQKLASQWLSGSALQQSPKQVEDQFFGLLGAYSARDKKVDLPDLTSRSLKDLTIRYSYTQPEDLFVTNEGTGIRIGRMGSLGNIIYMKDDQVQGPSLSPGIERQHIFIKNINVQNAHQLCAMIESPWVSAKRTCVQKEGGVEIFQEIITHKDRITLQEMHSQEFKSFKDKLNHSFRDVILIFKNQVSKATQSS